MWIVVCRQNQNGFFFCLLKKSKFQNLLSSDQSKYVFYVLQDFHLLRCLVSIKVALLYILGSLLPFMRLFWCYHHASKLPCFLHGWTFWTGYKKSKNCSTQRILQSVCLSAKIQIIQDFVELGCLNGLKYSMSSWRSMSKLIASSPKKKDVGR